MMQIVLILLLILNGCQAIPDLTINNCRANKYSFVDDDSNKIQGVWSITANGHCGSAVEAYEVRSDSKTKSRKSKLWEGLYESYGISNGVPRYEYTLSNGTVFQLLRREVGGQCFWIIGRGGFRLIPYFYAISDADSPPVSLSDGVAGDEDAVWQEYQPSGPGGIQASPGLRVIEHSYPEVKPRRKKLHLNQFEEEEDEDGVGVVAMDGSVVVPSKKERAESALLGSMLHPAVSARFGRFLRNTYRNAQPVPGISLDGLLSSRLLRRALDFLNSPIDGDGDEPSRWVGPETTAYCCRDKYRLDFRHWRGSKYSRALQSIASNARFIGFLEAMSGIRGLVPMKIAQEEIIWAGSTIIGVKPGGYLDVHNDFNLMEGLHRRINVLLYLNEDWEEQWQGHLEMWDHNNTRVVQRIPPVFNRMSIFTVTDDAFHGHPEPLNAPDGQFRYALQIVYYTKEPAESPNSPSDTDKRVFAKYHGAVFQPDCGSMAGLREFCEKEPDDSYRLACQCNFRDS